MFRLRYSSQGHPTISTPSSDSYFAEWPTAADTPLPPSKDSNLLPLMPSLVLVLLSFACRWLSTGITPCDIQRWACNGSLPYTTSREVLRSHLASSSRAFRNAVLTMLTPSKVPTADTLERRVAFLAATFVVQLPPMNVPAAVGRWVRLLGLPPLVMPNCLALHALLPVDAPALLKLDDVSAHRTGMSSTALAVALLMLAVRVTTVRLAVCRCGFQLCHTWHHPYSGLETLGSKHAVAGPHDANTSRHSQHHIV